VRWLHISKILAKRPKIKEKTAFAMQIVKVLHTSNCNYVQWVPTAHDFHVTFINYFYNELRWILASEFKITLHGSYKESKDWKLWFRTGVFQFVSTRKTNHSGSTVLYLRFNLKISPSKYCMQAVQDQDFHQCEDGTHSSVRWVEKHAADSGAMWTSLAAGWCILKHTCPT
jgi:hypothetical protein